MASRAAGIGGNWADVWASDVWDSVWYPAALVPGSSAPVRQIDIRTVVVALDPQHNAKSVEYEFSGGRSFYER